MNDSAHRLLALLTGSPDTPVTFQTFSDREKSGHLAQILHGRFDECAERLTKLNEAGAGVFIMVNEGDGQGRKEANVTSIRAVFVDCDRPDTEPLRLIDESGLDPDFVIESSPGKYHAYRRVSGFPLDKAVFAGVQMLLADRVRGDAAVKDLPRVMRLPGFLHRKGDPVMVRIHQVKHEGRVTPYAELLAELGITEADARARAGEAKTRGAVLPAPRADFVNTNVEFAIKLRDGEGRNRHCVRLAGWCARQGMNLERALAHVCAWNDANFEPLPNETVRDIVERMVEKEVAKRGEFQLSELGFSERVAHTLSPRHRFVADAGAWLHWNGCNWDWDTNDAVIQEAVKGVARGLLDEAAKEADDHKRQALIKHNRACETLRAVQAAIKLARSSPALLTSGSALDSDPFLLATDNALIDLRTGAAMAPDPHELITHRAHVEFVSGAECPRWVRFLDEVFAGDRQTIDYLQKVLGYAMCGSTREEVSFIFVGHGSNGKSTLLNTIQRLMGDYAQKMPSSALMVKRAASSGSTPSPEIARLRGARLAVTSEVATGRQLDEELLKNLCSQDPIAARFLHKDTFEFFPSHKLIFALNHLPTIASSDHGTWRRIRVIPFNRTFEGENKDAALAEKLLAEGAGILNWLIQGCLNWQREGLGEPDAVKVRTLQYRGDLDIIGQFIDEGCHLAVNDNPEHAEGYKTPAALLYRSYRKFCLVYGLPVVSNRLFGEEMKGREDAQGRKLVEARRTATGIVYRGITIRHAWLPEGGQEWAEALECVV